MKTNYSYAINTTTNIITFLAKTKPRQYSKLERTSRRSWTDKSTKKNCAEEKTTELRPYNPDSKVSCIILHKLMKIACS